MKPARPRPCGLCVHAWRARRHPAGLRRRSAPRALLPLVIYLGVELLVLHALELFGDAVEARLHICRRVLLCLSAAAPHHGGTSLLGGPSRDVCGHLRECVCLNWRQSPPARTARTRRLAHARRAHFGVTSHRQHTTAGTCRPNAAPHNSCHELEFAQLAQTCGCKWRVKNAAGEVLRGLRGSPTPTLRGSPTLRCYCYELGSL